MQIPKSGVAKYASQVLSVIVALIEDTEEEVAVEAVQGLGKVGVNSLSRNLPLPFNSLHINQTRSGGGGSLFSDASGQSLFKPL